MPGPRNGKAPELPRARTLTLTDGRTLEEGDEFSVPGEGRFRFAYEFLPDRSVTCWGPIGSDGSTANAQWRSFKPERIRTIHRKVKGRR